jgi:hypothetical protein
VFLGWGGVVKGVGSSEKYSSYAYLMQGSSKVIVGAKGVDKQKGKGKEVVLRPLDGLDNGGVDVAGEILAVGPTSGVLDGAGDGEVGEVGEFGYLEVVQCAKEIYPIVGISCVGHGKQFLALLTFLEEEHHHEVLASPSIHGSRELKNLECSIKFDARGNCSSCGIGKERVLSVF